MFELHPRLNADTIPVIDWPLCRILLMNECSWPWLVLVPRRHGITEIHELDGGDQELLIKEIAAASRRLQNLSGADKMNVAALGNMVPQLHIHVIARFQDDPAWPKPVFGFQPPASYNSEFLARHMPQLIAALTDDTN
ncbi:HIT domain-containing protein [Magnetospirillum sulfuroxidans]|uniref:HIT domain-containing protein n=1 Tax=Magnetospirillum sulfuroxidans TaxID=611300 RepID=A0ABS5I6T2_9PROT|nr:HIT family protein [Magnetospirillum sulfuroxidans]MBR9970131.1 HIT domain-containing protein [Magnetospirillum sulfuroxidans]